MAKGRIIFDIFPHEKAFPGTLEYIVYSKIDLEDI